MTNQVMMPVSVSDVSEAVLMVYSKIRVHSTIYKSESRISSKTFIKAVYSVKIL